MPTNFYLKDNTNQTWAIGVNDSGSLASVKQSGTTVIPIVKDFQTGLTAWQIGITSLGLLQTTNVPLQPSLINEISLLSNPSNILFGLLVNAVGELQTTRLDAITAGGITTIVQSLLNDAEGDYWNFNLLLPFLKMAYQDLSDSIDINQFQISRQETVVLSLPANSRVLAFGTYPSLPANLINPIYLEERLSGQTDQDWIQMEQREFAPDLIPDNYLGYWWWDGYQINFLGSNSSEDIKLQYEAALWSPQSQGDYILPRGSERFLEHRTAHYAADSIGDEYHATREMSKSQLILQEFLVKYVQTQQGFPARRIGYRRRAKGFRCFR